MLCLGVIRILVSYEPENPGGAYIAHFATCATLENRTHGTRRHVCATPDYGEGSQRAAGDDGRIAQDIARSKVLNPKSKIQ